MTALEVKNQILDILKQDNLAQDEKISAVKILLMDKLGSKADSKAKEVLNKFSAWENYVKNILNDPAPKNLQPYYNIKYFDLIKFYYLYQNQFDEITNEQIKDGILETKKLRNVTVDEKKKGSVVCKVFGVNVTLSSVPDSNQSIITFNRLIAVLGYMNAIREIKAESSLSMQINWMCCSNKVRERKYLFFHGCEDLLASIIMGSATNFDSDDIAFLYGGTTLMSYLSYCNTMRKENPNAKILPLENWMKKPVDQYSFKGKYPDLVSRVEDNLTDNGRELICNIFKNAFVMPKNPHDKNQLFPSFSRTTRFYRGGPRPRHLKYAISSIDLSKKF